MATHLMILKIHYYILKKKPVPTVIICRTIKGKGVSFMQDDNLWHYRAPNDKEFFLAKKELGF